MKFNHKYFPSNKHTYLTKEGLDELKSKLDELRTERFDVCDQLRKMDSKEKFEHILSTDAIKMLQMNESEVTKISEVLNNAVTVNGNNKSDIQLGSRVDLKFGNNTLEFMLVDSIEADPSNHKISDKSPLGKALLSKKTKETVKLLSPRGKEYFYKVLHIA